VILERLLANQEKINAKVEAWQQEIKEMKVAQAEMVVRAAACQEKMKEEMDAMRLEANQEETEAAVEQQDVFKKETYFDTIGSSEDQCKGRRLVVRSRRGAKKWIQDSVGSRQKVSAARKRVVRCTIDAHLRVVRWESCEYL
jgi:hypothetical protein